MTGTELNVKNTVNYLGIMNSESRIQNELMHSEILL